jgi:hypothetical protein
MVVEGVAPFAVVVTAVYAGAWGLASLYAVSNLFWLYEAVAALRHDPPAVEWGLDEIQLRVLTIDAESVVQETVDSLPDGLDREQVYVVAESAIEIDGAEVAVVPDSFDCRAENKGRALEWANRNVDCDREYVLFLDEDTHVTDLPGLPDSDVVQFRERPVRTDSRLAYWAEIVRMGYQFEQLAFPRFEIPLYAWGGGIAVRRSLEERVGWNYPSIVEDTSFVWRAAHEHDAGFEVMHEKWRNQAPPSLRAMIQQRRRWLAGTVAEEDYLPVEVHGWLLLRNLAWVVSPGVPVLVWLTFLLSSSFPLRAEFRLLSVVFLAFMFVWLIVGFVYYDWPLGRDLLLAPLEPAVMALHSLGATIGAIDPPTTFEQTEKEDHTLDAEEEN